MRVVSLNQFIKIWHFSKILIYIFNKNIDFHLLSNSKYMMMFIGYQKVKKDKGDMKPMKLLCPYI